MTGICLFCILHSLFNGTATAKYFRNIGESDIKPMLIFVWRREDHYLIIFYLNVIYQNSGGIPRMINALCSKTLTIGALEKKESLSEDEVFRATQEM